MRLDFDFFTPRSFEPAALARRLAQAGAFTQEQRKKDTRLGTFEQVKISFFRYAYPQIGKHRIALNTAIASVPDIGAMKLDAIGTRGRKHDFIDLYFIRIAQGMSTMRERDQGEQEWILSMSQ